MLGRLVEFHRRINPKRVPEDSVALRVSVLVSVLVSELTILAMGYYGMVTVLAVPLLTMTGFAVSWRQRRRRNLLLKAVLSVLVIAAAVSFFRELSASLYDTRLPLIRLLLWLQVLHSFDLPARKDLKFSLASGLIMVAAGAVLSIGMTYAIGLVLFSLAAAVALVFFQLSEDAGRACRVETVRIRPLIAYGAAIWLVGLTVAVPVLLLIPQSSQARMHTLPLSGLNKVLGDFSSNVVNPAYPSSGNPFEGPPRFSPDSYYGFNPYMDLRSRGQLSDDIVLKVRSDSYSYYRGVVFNRYNGKGWETGAEDATELSADSPPIDLNLGGPPVLPFKTQVETFYVQQDDMPNIIFASWRPISLYFPANRIKVDPYGSLRSPFGLTSDTVYSVISDVPVYPADTLRNYPRATDAPASAADTELPASPGLDEVERLARQVTSPYSNRYDQVNAIEQYLKRNYRYNLDVPPQTQDMDAVAYFLFQQKEGYCEHFASAMAVMARSVGIPARVVTGYAGGSYNPFTGLWEVKESDAHAWVEVYFGAAGWVPFDPTPGFDVPAASQSQIAWPAARIFSYLSGVFSSGPVGAVLGGAAGVLSGAITFMRRLPLLLMSLVALGALALAAGAWQLLLRLTRERRRRLRLAAALDSTYLKEPVLRQYLDVAAGLEGAGLARRREETLREFSARVGRWLGTAEFTELSAMVERLRYGGKQEAGAMRDRAVRLAQALMEKLEAVRRRHVQDRTAVTPAAGPDRR